MSIIRRDRLYGHVRPDNKQQETGVPFMHLEALLVSVIAFGADGAVPPKRVPWNSSRVVGTPEPPPPFRTERVFSNVRFDHCLDVTHAPGTDRLLVVEQGGKIFSVLPTNAGGRKDLFVDLPKEIKSLKRSPKAKQFDAAYGIAFHPNFGANRYCYICYVVGAPGQQIPDGSRVSRFRVTNADPPRLDMDSETILLTFMAGGHNGGSLHFGRDGCLYISTGDAADPNPPDKHRTGQDCSDLLASILRIDVDHADKGLPYAIPNDNPFVGLPKVRPEIWAFGFRNPWRMSFDRKTGDLWVGDVGWELWEMVQRVKKGGNYGWSIVEGRQPVNVDMPVGPTPILPPTLELPHSVAASVTGGFVYRGSRLPELEGAYIFGDWETRRLWAFRHDGSKAVSLTEITEPTLRVVAFGEDAAGELYILDYDAGTINRLERNPKPPASRPFPTKLSETGLFASTKDATPAPGVLPFEIQAEQWSDGATATRWLALPGDSSITWHPQDVPIPNSMFSRQLDFPAGAVLVKTLSLEMERGNPSSSRRVETQLLHYDGRLWRAYTYEWNQSQTEATLVPSDGVEKTLNVSDKSAHGGTRQHTWAFAGRTQCFICHNPWAQTTLAFNVPQINREVDVVGSPGNQLATFEKLGVLKRVGTVGRPLKPLDASSLAAAPRFVRPNDDSAEIDKRARSYLHANCGHCHRFGGGGAVDLQLHYFVELKETKTLNVRPAQGTFGISDGVLIAPGEPHRSVAYYRASKFGRGRMPHLGSEIPDEKGLALLHHWIEKLPRNDQKPPTPVEPNLNTVAGAMPLARKLASGALASSEREQTLRAAAEHPLAEVRDLFSGFQPVGPRGPRVGTAPKPAAILALKGDANKGRDLYWRAASLQCRNCHRIGSEGVSLGPDLTKIGAQRSRAELLESILEPSKRIDAPFASYIVQKSDGTAETGLLVRRDAEQIILRNAKNEEIRIRAADAEQVRASTKSLMPDGLLRDSTLQEAADLVEYLSSLR